MTTAPAVLSTRSTWSVTWQLPKNAGSRWGAENLEYPDADIALSHTFVTGTARDTVTVVYAHRSDAERRFGWMTENPNRDPISNLRLIAETVIVDLHAEAHVA